jgi:carbamoyltransferase
VSSELTIGYLPVGHDPSIAIVNDAGIVAIAEEERYSRVKRGRFVPDPQWLFDVLDEFGADPARVTCLAVPNLVGLQERRNAASLADLPRLGQARLVSSLIDRAVARLPGLETVEHHRHHVCHAASTYLASPFDPATIVTVDGMGETETATISLGTSGSVKRIEATELPVSLGYVYQALAGWSGLTGVEREGKFMGLASWGAPTMVDEMRRWFVSSDAAGRLQVSASLSDLPVTSASWSAYVAERLGPPRAGEPDAPDPLAADVAASIQVIVEEALLAYCDRARTLTGADSLCLAGGVFMNTVANGVLQRSGLFEEVFVQPLASDSGLALGAALLSHRRRSPEAKRWVMTTAALGSDIGNDPAPLTDPARAGDIADRILGGQVIGWVRGRAEVGARALGQRSVLADARDPLTPERINDKLKRRERWRPFAPMILEEDAAAWGLVPSPFMTFVHTVPDSFRAQFPAVVHIDGSARLQTIGQDADSLLRELLFEIRDRTGTGVLLNTSLNGPGMPIVRTRDHALDLLRSSDLDAMVLGDRLLDRPPAASDDGPCSCGLDVDILLELVPPEPGSCIERHAGTVHRVPLTATPGTGGLEGSMPDLGDKGTVTVLLPTWLDLVAECLPKLVDWLQDLQGTLSTPLVLIDANCCSATLADLLATSRPGTGGFATEIETFWLARVSRWHP